MSDDHIKKLEMQLFSEKALRQSLEETVSIQSQRQNDRIKQLEAALREIIQMDPLRPAFSCQRIARAALEGKKDE